MRSIFIVFALTILLGAFFFFIFILKNSVSAKNSVGTYSVQVLEANGLCEVDQIINPAGVHVVTFELCEDNIVSMTEEGGWFIVLTTAGRSYRKNLSTGEEILSNAPTSGFGGGMRMIP